MEGGKGSPGAPRSLNISPMLGHYKVLDNGGANFARSGLLVGTLPGCIQNAVGKVKGRSSAFTGDQLLKGLDISSVSLRRPADRGYVVNWDLQRQIWQRIFQVAVPSMVPGEAGLILTEPLMNLPALQEETFQVVFEDLGFGSMADGSPPPQLGFHHWAVHNPGAPAARAATGL
eukprot:jgi/Botrbrau1/1922/Bobra.0005s0027.1